MDSDSLQQCMASSRGRTYKIFLGGPSLGQNRAHIYVLGRFLKFDSFSLKLNTVIAYNKD